ncbi:MAG TPA: S-layer homology domain-containing protein [Thermoanaerobaculia bacterium]|jgi:hypothetical protein
MKRLLVSLFVGSALSIGLATGIELAQNSGGAWSRVEWPGAQTDGAPTGYGTASWSAETYVAQAFIPVDSGVTYAFDTTNGNLAIYRTNPSGSVWFEAPIHLPSGSLLEAVEFRFCDNSPSRVFQSFLSINDKNGTLTQPPLVGSTMAENFGCINRTFTFQEPVPIDDANQAYALEVNLGGTGTPGDDTILLCQARVYYRLRVSPAPETATFPNDVPTDHPFFQYVEALAAAGITAGTGPGTYGVDQPLTRGQMAVFLSLALGLHFTP